jgi:iron complex outermembrane receptor protein
MMKMSGDSRRLTVTAVALAVSNVLMSAASAQGSSGAILEEVMVTAERRAENLQDIPISASVFTADALADMGIKNVHDLQQVSPSLAINTYNRSTFINIRGVGLAQSAPTTSPGVAFYIDGVFIPHEFTIGTSFYDIAAIEVLRGPQGTLTGQNSTGGAVYARTPQPEFGKWSGFVDQMIADYDWTKTTAAVNVPVGEKLAFRVAGVLETRDSFTKNIRVPGSFQGPRLSQPGNVDTRGYRVAMAYQPSDILRINLRYEDYLNDYENNAVKNRNDAITKNPFIIEEDAISYLVQDGYRTSGEILLDATENVRIRWLSAFEHGIYEDMSDGDRTATTPPRSPSNPTAQGRVSYGRTKINTAVHELNVLSMGESDLTWVAGAFHMTDTTDIAIVRYNLSTVLPNTTPTAFTLTKSEITSQSVFAQVGYRFSPQWQLTVGARYSDDEQVYDRATNVADEPGIQRSSETTGRVALNWNVSDDVLLYASLSKGYKAGGVNLRPIDPNFGPETNTVTELGAKTTLLDGHLRANGAIFYSDYKDIQYLSLVNQVPLQQNAASATSRGVELELLGVWGGFQFNAGIAYLDAEFSKQSVLNDAWLRPLGPGGPVGGNGTVRKGDPMPFAPEITANLGMQYSFNVGNGTLTPRVQVSYIDEQLSTPFRHEETIVPSRTIADVRVTYEPNSSWRFEAFATNVTDKTYIASQLQNSSSFDGGIIYGPPRVIGGRFTYSF